MMYLEKNFMENILYTILRIASKIKDNPKAWQNVTFLCNHPNLHLVLNNKQKPKAPYELTLEERCEVLKWLKEEVKFHYASSWSRCINLTRGIITGLKNHDLYVFMERLLHSAFKDYISDTIWGPLCEILSFFREICAKELK
jgi:hypothetical protein